MNLLTLPDLTPLWVAGSLCGVLALTLFIYAGQAFRRRKVMGGGGRLLFSLVFLLLALLSGLVSLGIHGYEAFTNEQLAATVSVETTAPQTFTATFALADGGTRAFELAGDELYVDAKILKWHPWANLLGLKTQFELDRVSGRYRLLDDEQTMPRTLYSLALDRAVDVFALEQRFATPLLDAEYGSGTFVPVRDGGALRDSGIYDRATSKRTRVSFTCRVLNQLIEDFPKLMKQTTQTNFIRTLSC